MKFLMICLIFTLSTLSQAREVAIDTSTSAIDWIGQKKLPGDAHNGIVKIKKGTINLDKNMKLVGGSLVIDMKSIEDQDLNGQWKTKLETHLNSPDFFDTEKNPEANFKITKVEPTRSDLVSVTGNLTLRGQTHPETFQVKIEKVGNTMKATGKIELDRNKYGVTYNSESNALKNAIKIAKDKIIKDTIFLSLNLTTEKI